MAVAFDIAGLSHTRPAPKVAPRSALLPAPEHLHERCARKIRRHVARVMGADDDHEDLVQEVLLTVLLKLDTLRDPACFDGWVAQITTNKLRVAMRRRSMRRQAIGLFLAQQGDDSVQMDLEACYAAHRVRRLVGRLSPNERALLLAQWFTPGTRGAVAASIAAQSGCSIITVRRRLSRASARFEKTGTAGSRSRAALRRPGWRRKAARTGTFDRRGRNRKFSRVILERSGCHSVRRFVGVLPLAVALGSSAAHAEPRFAVDLAYRPDPAVEGCPSDDEFRTMISDQLGYEPFRAGAAQTVVARAQAAEQGLRGFVEWHDSSGSLRGERELGTESKDCRELARAMSFAIAVQIQILAQEAEASEPLPEKESAPPEREREPAR